MAKTFDPKQVSIIIGGHIVQGFADGTFAKLARNNEMFALKVGADGEGARAKSNDKSGRLEITLLQSSASNDVLSGFALADELNNQGQVPALIKDNNGTTLCQALTAWIVKQADVEMGKEITDRVWIVESDAWDMLVGGNV